jgi:acyl-CoA synthetase (AMP-forming)/AMP-acid ligase II
MLDTTQFPTFGDVIAGHARERPGSVAVRFGDRVWTYAGLQHHAERVAATLLERGMAVGDRFGLLSCNSDLHPISAIAAARAGLIFVPINWRLSTAEIIHIVHDAGITRLFVEKDAAAWRAALPGLSIEPAEVLLDPHWLVATRACPVAADSPRTTVLLVYTSGTTGVPKGVMLSHQSLFATSIARMAAKLSWDHWDADDVTLVPLPLAHIGGFSMLARSLLTGGEAIIQPVFDAGQVLDAIEHQGVSKIGLVPTAMKMVIDHPRSQQVDYSRIKTMLYGAAPITLDVLRAGIAVFGCAFAQSYGMSETGATCVVLPPEDHDPAGNARMRAAGKALPGTQLRILGDDGRALPSGQVGEIAIHTVGIMNGYWNRPDMTAAVLSDDGWYRTGDAGYLDDDGYLFIMDRIKDMIISGAENVYPAEVENVMSLHDAVDEVAVIGVPDPRWGETVKAIVVPTADHAIAADALPDALIAWTRERLAHYKAPRSIDIVAALPRNASGKIDKPALRRPYWAGRERAVN